MGKKPTLGGFSKLNFNFKNRNRKSLKNQGSYSKSKVHNQRYVNGTTKYLRDQFDQALDVALAKGIKPEKPPILNDLNPQTATRWLTAVGVNHAHRSENLSRNQLDKTSYFGCREATNP